MKNKLCEKCIHLKNMYVDNSVCEFCSENFEDNYQYNVGIISGNTENNCNGCRYVSFTGNEEPCCVCSRIQNLEFKPIKNNENEEKGMTDKLIITDDKTDLRPDHYKLDGLDVTILEVIRARLGEEGYKYFCLGNEIKYILRKKQTDKSGISKKDIEKAKTYSNFILKEYEEDEK